MILLHDHNIRPFMETFMEMEYQRMNQNGMKKGEDIMMNLLDASSDSGPEPLNLPPLKGKKLSKRYQLHFYIS